MPLKYLKGFNNYHCSETINGALPKGQNSPQKVPYDLYAEQLSGTAFTVNREHNLHSWLYRIKPSVGHEDFTSYKQKQWITAPINVEQNPTQTRWEPLPEPKNAIDFIDAMITYAVNGNSALHTGGAIHLFSANKNMENRFFYNADGEMLIVLQYGELLLITEFGLLELTPGEIAVIPRGVKFSVDIISDYARGYVCENYGIAFQLPERGLIGANGLANTRDFLYPHAHYHDEQDYFTLLCKFQGHFWQAKITEHPCNVVAWHGNYAPYKYNLSLFNAMNTVTFDHPDPSIFTVLTSPSTVAGVANIDFVIFPERWMVAEHTFRPPYYHRNVMSEFMGLIRGQYDAKEEGFKPGGASLHNCMSAHGPDSDAYQKAISQNLKPEYYKDTLAFMFESCYVWQQTEFAMKTSLKQKNYLSCWNDLPRNFSSSEDS